MRFSGKAATLLATAATATALALVPAAPASQATPVAQSLAMQALQTGILQELNTLRASHHLKPLVLSPQLSAAATVHDKEMAAKGYFSHDSSDGGQFWQRVKHFYRASGYNYWAVGENLLWSSPDVDPTNAIKLWYASPEHKKNMLDPHWHEIGISALHLDSGPGVYGDQSVTIVTTDFGVRTK